VPNTTPAITSSARARDSPSAWRARNQWNQSTYRLIAPSTSEAAAVGDSPTDRLMLAAGSSTSSTPTISHTDQFSTLA